jgi:hypothetical protein
MKRAVVLLSVLAVLGCASQHDSGPPVTINLAPLDTMSDLFYFPGPVSLRFQVSVSNPTSETVTVRRLDLRSVAGGAYHLRGQSTPINVKIAPNSTATFTISTWGYARGGYITSAEPVTIQGTAYFDSPSGQFVKIFQQNIIPR